ncbi:phage GP46 family protein [Paraburkholderia adhaesiva]|uniref:phage GP46 family protein n=1 Tax=Paraburkholderia adhaesiva TaxID=2883244 RepID=UPI001F2D8BDB|nr:phage GP46 family protein [Paraburkholderia adhaesiva]
MGDVRTVWYNPQQVADYVVENGLLGNDDGLVSAALISLFTDGRALDDDVIPDAPAGQTGDPRGWWADEYSSTANDAIGSRLWLNESAKQLPIVLTQDQERAREALQWMLDDGLVSQIDVTATNPRDGVRVLRVTLYGPDDAVTRLQFQDFWERH